MKKPLFCYRVDHISFGVGRLSPDWFCTILTPTQLNSCTNCRNSSDENFPDSKMSNEAFDGQILTDKLLKLNNSQQSIECILHLETLTLLNYLLWLRDGFMYYAFLLTFWDQHCQVGVFPTGRKLSKSLKHGINCLILPRESGVFLFFIWPMTYCKIVGEKEVSLWMNSGKSFLQLSSLSMGMVMKMEKKQFPDWWVFC